MASAGGDKGDKYDSYGTHMCEGDSVNPMSHIDAHVQQYKHLPEDYITNGHTLDERFVDGLGSTIEESDITQTNPDIKESSKDTYSRPAGTTTTSTTPRKETFPGGQFDARGKKSFAEEGEGKGPIPPPRQVIDTTKATGLRSRNVAPPREREADELAKPPAGSEASPLPALQGIETEKLGEQVGGQIKRRIIGWWDSIVDTAASLLSFQKRGGTRPQTRGDTGTIPVGATGAVGGGFFSLNWRALLVIAVLAVFCGVMLWRFTLYLASLFTFYIYPASDPATALSTLYPSTSPVDAMGQSMSSPPYYHVTQGGPDAMY